MICIIMLSAVTLHTQGMVAQLSDPDTGPLQFDLDRLT